MQRIDNATAATTLPTPAAAGTPGYFTDGNPGGGVPATVVPADWLNLVQEELVNTVVAAGITPSKTTFNQLAAAIKATCPVVGSSRGVRMAVASASATATLTATEVVVETSAGLTFRLSNFNQAINLASTGAGGMDTGTAPTSGYVALYAIYNPSTAAASLLAVNVTSSVAPEVYGGANMPAGYTASALVSVWPTNASKQFVAGLQLDRIVSIPFVSVLSTSSTQGSPTALNVANAIPPNARRASGSIAASSSAASSIALSLYASASGSGIQGLNTGTSASVSFRGLPISVQQTIYYTATSTAGTPAFAIAVSEYEF